MEIKKHEVDQSEICEVISDRFVIESVEDGLDLLGYIYFQGFDKIVLHEKDLIPAFFELKNGMAGEILQKFSNYRVRLAIVGDFARYSSKSLNDFIQESNKFGHINFVGSVSEAISRLAKNKSTVL